MNKIRLREAIRDLRSELEAARSEGQDAGIQFAVGPVELEFEVSLEKEATANGEITTFWIIAKAGAEGKVSQGTTQKIKVMLTPVDRSGATPITPGQVWVMRPTGDFEPRQI